MQKPKPVLYIPTMAMVVPCDYKPKSENVEIRYQITAAYRWHAPVWRIMEYPAEHVPRTIEGEPT